MGHRKIPLLFISLLLLGSAVWAEDNQEESIQKPLSNEDLEIIKNLELLQNLDILQNGDTNLLENYDEISSLNKDEGGSNENQTNR